MTTKAERIDIDRADLKEVNEALDDAQAEVAALKTERDGAKRQEKRAWEHSLHWQDRMEESEGQRDAAFGLLRRARHSLSDAGTLWGEIDTLLSTDTPETERHEFERVDEDSYLKPQHCAREGCGNVKEHEVHDHAPTPTQENGT